VVNGTLDFPDTLPEMTMREAIQEALAACGLVDSEISFEHFSTSFVSPKGCKGKISIARVRLG